MKTRAGLCVPGRASPRHGRPAELREAYCFGMPARSTTAVQRFASEM
jgi:hypothetical protein